MRGQGATEDRFRFDARNMFFTVSVVRCWNRLPRKVINVLSLNVQDQVEQGFEQPGLVKDVPACNSRLELEDL